MKRTLMAGLAGMALVAGVACKPQFDQSIYTTIVNGSCQKLASIGRITVAPGGRARWVVVSGCGKETSVGLTAFAAGTSESCKGPTTADVEHPCSNVAELSTSLWGNEIKYITCNVRSNLPEGCWNYKVNVNGVDGPDPELDVRKPPIVTGSPKPPPVP